MTDLPVAIQIIANGRHKRHFQYFIVDTASRLTGLSHVRIGDIAHALDTKTHYVATDPTTWSVSAGDVSADAAGSGITVSGGVITAVTSTSDSTTVATSETRANAAYGDLATGGPTVAVTIGASGKCLVIVSAFMMASAGGAYMSFTDGTYGPTDPDAAHTEENVNVLVTRPTLVSGLAAGSHSFQAKYRCGGGGTGTFADRRIIAMPL